MGGADDDSRFLFSAFLWYVRHGVRGTGRDVIGQVRPGGYAVGLFVSQPSASFSVYFCERW